MDIGDKAKELAEDAAEKAKDAAAKLDDKAEELAGKEGIVGKIAGAAHKVLDKLDGDK
ncbi:MAG: CsbD family protein [Acidimicrobiia bacterium]